MNVISSLKSLSAVMFDNEPLACLLNITLRDAKHIITALGEVRDQMFKVGC